jgi:hypothetical protein
VPDSFDLGEGVARLTRVLHAAANSAERKALALGFFGGSVTHQGLYVWPLKRKLSALYLAANVTLHNFGVPAAGPSYASFCMANVAGPALANIDVFVLEWAVNDDQKPPESMEHVMRTLLTLPHAPAVLVYLHCSPRYFDRGAGTCNAPSYMPHWQLAAHYGLGVLHALPLLAMRPNLTAVYKDYVHPSPAGGEMIAGQLLCLLQSAAGLASPLNAPPVPLAPALYAKVSGPRRCWTTLGEPEARNMRPAWNDGGWMFVSRTDVYPSGKNGWQADVAGRGMSVALPGCIHTVRVFYLASYDATMGGAVISLHGCPAANATLHGHWTNTIRISVSQDLAIPAGCSPGFLNVTSLARAYSGGEGATFQVIAVGCE